MQKQDTGLGKRRGPHHIKKGEKDMNILKLKNPIKINGREVAELNYDENEITAEAFIDAECRKFAEGRKKGGLTAAAIELDYSMQLQLGFAAILAVNPSIDYNDLLRIKGADLIAVSRIGRNFTMPSASEEEPMDSEASRSENV